jgi:TPR repeat protein
MSNHVKNVAGYKQCISSIADTFVCPITMEYVFTPVIAEDGRVYEQWALQQWMDKDESLTFKSPATGVNIGKVVVHSLQIRQSIEHAINSGAVDSKKAYAWKRKLHEEKQFALLKKAAENGDLDATSKLGFYYRDGLGGKPVNVTEAIKCFQFAAEQDDPPATTALGVLHINGKGVARNVSKGIELLFKSADLKDGSEHACAILGESYADGRLGMTKNMEAATHYFGKMKKCTNRDSISLYRKKAKAVCSNWENKINSTKANSGSVARSG